MPINLKKLESLGLQKAITACMRHRRFPFKDNHIDLHAACNKVAVKLWNKASTEERNSVDRISTSEEEIKQMSLEV